MMAGYVKLKTNFQLILVRIFQTSPHQQIIANCCYYWQHPCQELIVAPDNSTNSAITVSNN